MLRLVDRLNFYCITIQANLMMNIYLINTLKEYIENIQLIKNSDKRNLNFFYRGQCSKYNPLPSVFRDGFMDKEDFLYHELILRCPEKFSGLSHLETLVMMQHYGLPTRLLDVTTNPLVALYFACKDYSGKHKNESGRVYIYGVPDDKIAYSDSDRVLMLSCLPIFSFLDKSKMLKIVNMSILNNSTGIDKNKDNTYPAAIERLYREITKEVPAFKRDFKPSDLVTPIFVKPLRANARILKQDGAFIISGLCHDSKEAENKILEMESNVIKVSDREKILHELDDFGINEASLFPEVDKVAEYLKEKCDERINRRR